MVKGLEVNAVEFTDLFVISVESAVTDSCENPTVTMPQVIARVKAKCFILENG